MRIKTFKQFLKDEKETYYTLDLDSDITDDELIDGLNEFIPYIKKLLKSNNVRVISLPILEEK